ncbi:hypothetical protein M0D46_07890 [Xanthomonas prunicola]|uniref:hypothetical protein n=1 Tax=Xanthomonas prunicola TaxID=2053930 RepID=UPI0021B40AC6|nr:hypothetical protein [Xanthomonas prunicola]UXA70928.1 hypothetical protein M0D46_07890 [Xanthomonas prunicola]
MARHSPQLEAALSQFSAQPGVSPDQAAQLRDALKADVGLLSQLDKQAQAGVLRGFAVQASGIG